MERALLILLKVGPAVGFVLSVWAVVDALLSPPEPAESAPLEWMSAD
jgi:hypothetical protein